MMQMASIERFLFEQNACLDEFHIQECSKCINDFLERPLVKNIVSTDSEFTPLIAKIVETRNSIKALAPQNIQASPIPHAIPVQEATLIHQFEPISDTYTARDDGFV